MSPGVPGVILFRTVLRLPWLGFQLQYSVLWDHASAFRGGCVERD